MRTRAIFCSLLYGILPSRCYEPTPHYDCGYWHHLWINLVYASRWMINREDDSDREFEALVNSAPVPIEHCAKTRMIDRVRV